MKVAFITRSTLNSTPGGDTVQVRETAKQLAELNTQVDVYPANAKISYNQYDLLHLFNITRPADLIKHSKISGKPYVVTPILVNYAEYDKQFRKGASGRIMRLFSPFTNEYIKSIGRWLKRKETLVSKSYLWKGHRKSMQQVLEGANYILPNSTSETEAVRSLFSGLPPFSVIPNGVDTTLFKQDPAKKREPDLVICAARIEGIKNQHTLIKAINKSPFRLILIGTAAPNQKAYYEYCRKIAGENIIFKGQMKQEELLHFYQQAAVHVLPSWFETCGLSSLEAAATGCNIVVTEKGFTRDYFGESAFYCEPENAESILQAIEKAAAFKNDGKLVNKIQNELTWQMAAQRTRAIYDKILSR